MIQTLAALWQLGTAFKLSWMAGAAAACVPPSSSQTRYGRGDVTGGGAQNFVHRDVVGVLECETRDIVYSQRLEIENFNRITGSGRPNPLDWGEHRMWAVEERNQKGNNKSQSPLETVGKQRVVLSSLSIILGKHTAIHFNKEVGDYCVLDLVLTDGGHVSMIRQTNGDNSYMDFNGKFVNVLISDPRASLGSLYGDIVTAPIVIFSLSIGVNGNENQSNSSRGGNQGDDDGSKRRRRPYKRFSLQFLSGPRVVYIQQLWLESLDYITNGILGPPLLGGTVAPDGHNSLLEWLRARDGREPIGSSQLEVRLENATCLVPHSLNDKSHILGHLSSLRFLTWIEREEVIGDKDGRRTLKGRTTMSPFSSCKEFCEEKGDLSNSQRRDSSDSGRKGKSDSGGEENDERETTTIQMVSGSSSSSVTSGILQVRRTTVEVPSLTLEAADGLGDDEEQYYSEEELLTTALNGGQRRHLLGRPLKLVVSMSNPSGWDSEMLAERLSSTELMGGDNMSPPLHALCIHISLFPLEGASPLSSYNCQPTMTTTTSERGEKAVAVADGHCVPLASPPQPPPLVIQLDKWSLGVLLAVLRHNLSANGFNGLDTASLWSEGRRNPSRNIILDSNLKWAEPPPAVATSHLNNDSEMMVVGSSSSCCSSCNEPFTYMINPYYCCGCGGLKCRQCLTSGTVACVHPSVMKVGDKNNSTTTFYTAALLCQLCAGQAFESLRSRPRSRVWFGFGSELPKSRPISVQWNSDTIECFLLELEGGQRRPPKDHNKNFGIRPPPNQESFSSHSNCSAPVAPVGNGGAAPNDSKQHTVVAVIALEGLSLKFSRGAQKGHCLGIIANMFTVTSLRQGGGGGDVIHSKLIASQNDHHFGENRMQSSSMFGIPSSNSSDRSRMRSSSGTSSNPSSSSPRQSSDDHGGDVIEDPPRPDIEFTLSKSNAGVRKLNLATNQTQVTLAPREWMSILTAAFKFPLFEGMLQTSDLAMLHRACFSSIDGSFLDYILKLASSRSSNSSSSTTTSATTTVENEESYAENKGYGYTSFDVNSSLFPPPEYHAHAVLYGFKVIVLEDESSSKTNAIVLQGLVVTQYLCVSEPLTHDDDKEKEGSGSSSSSLPTTTMVMTGGGLLKENALISREMNLKVGDLYSWVLVNTGCNYNSTSSDGVGVTTTTKQQLGDDDERCNNNTSEFGILEPISMSVDIIGVEYPLQPFTQRITCEFNRIESQFSYRYLKIVEGIMTGCLTSLNMMKRNIGELKSSKNYCTECSSSSYTSDLVTTSKAFFYDVVFKMKTLGIVLRKQGGIAVLEAANAEVMRNAAQLHIGDEVAAIAGKSVMSLSYDSIIDMIQSHSTRPLCITFRCSVYAWGRNVGVSEYVLVHNLGNELEGIKICAGGIGNQAVVMHVPKDWKPQGGSDVILESEGTTRGRIHKPCRPRPGSVLMSVNGISTDTLSVSETWKLIQSTQRPIRVRYRDIPSSAWPQCQVQLELTCSQIIVTVMDVHDAASLMLEMIGIVVNGESGPGVQRLLTRHKDPRHPFNRFAKKYGGGAGGGVMHSSRINSSSSIVVKDKKISRSNSLDSQSQLRFSDETKVSANSRRYDLLRNVLMVRRLDCNVEAQLLYYNSRVSTWEPFLEPTKFNVGYEDAVPMVFECTQQLRRPKSSTTSSSCYNWSNKEGGLSAIHVTCSQDLCINVTDSFLECFRNILLERDVFFANQHVERPLSHPYAPFVLQNRTEYPLEFWVHNKKISNIPISYDIHQYHPLRGTKCHFVGPFSDCQFVSERGVKRDGNGGGRSSSVATGTETGSTEAATAELPPTNHSHHLRKGDGDIALHVSIRFSSIERKAPPPLASQPLLNLPLLQVGVYGLSCFLGQVDSTSGLPFGDSLPGANDDLCVDGNEKMHNNSGLEKIGVVWEVRLESARRLLTLKSAIEILNSTGDDLELKCTASSSQFLFNEEENSSRGGIKKVISSSSTNSNEDVESTLTTVLVQQKQDISRGGENGERKEEETPLGIIMIHPGEKYALPLGWSNLKSKAIYIRPTNLPGQTSYDYCDCSLLLPSQSSPPAVATVAVTTDGEAGASDNPKMNLDIEIFFLQAVSWIKCTGLVVACDHDEEEDNPYSSISSYQADGGNGVSAAIPPLLPYFFFVNARNRSPQLRGYVNDGSISNKEDILSMTESGEISKFSCHRGSLNLPFRPVLLEVYSCLLIRNALPLSLAYRVCSTIVLPHQTSTSQHRNVTVIESGILQPGAVKHVCKANILIGHVDISYRVTGFDWTIRQRLEKPGVVHKNCNNNNSSSATMTGGSTMNGHGGAGDWETYMKREVLVCHNSADQLLYLSMEATSPRPNCLSLVLWTDFWIRNLSGLPLIIGEPVLHMAPDGTLLEEDKSNKNYSSPRHNGGGVIMSDASLAPVQNSSVVEEVFEIYYTPSRGVNSWSGGVASYFASTQKNHNGVSTEDHLWCRDSGQPHHPPQNVKLPDDRWTWASNWEVDYTGKVSPDGWESCHSRFRSMNHSNAGGCLSYGSDMFTSERMYNETEPMHRRRWFRLRKLKGAKLEELYKKSLSLYGAVAGGDDGDTEGALSSSPLDGGGNCCPMKEESNNILDLDNEGDSSSNNNNTNTSFTRSGVTVYQPTSSLLSMSDTRRESAAVCIKIGDSAWSYTLPIGIPGCDGALEIPGTRWPEMMDVHHQQHKDNRSGGGNNELSATEAGTTLPCPLYELSYNVTVPPAPWNKTRIVTIASRYAIVNKSRTLCFLAQQEGAGRKAIGQKHYNTSSLHLPPGSSRPLHWSDRNLEQRLCLTIAATGFSTNSNRRDPSYLWSGGISIKNIGSFPVLIRSTQDVFSSSMTAYLMQKQQQQPLKNDEKKTCGGGYAAAIKDRGASLAPSMKTTLDDEGLAVLPCSKVVNVTVAFGEDLTLKGKGNMDSKNVQKNMATTISHSTAAAAAVHVTIEEEGVIGGPAPSFRLENHSPIPVYYAQYGVTGAGDILPAKAQCLFGWEIPCPTDLSYLKLNLSAAPFNSQSGKRMSRCLNLHKLGSTVDMEVEGKASSSLILQVKIVPDGPTKVARIKAIPVPDSALVTAGRAIQFLTNQKDELILNQQQQGVVMTPSSLKLKRRKAAPLMRVGPQSTPAPFINRPHHRSLSPSLIPYSDSSSGGCAGAAGGGGDVVMTPPEQQHHDGNKMNSKEGEDKEGGHEKNHELSSTTFEGGGNSDKTTAAEHLWAFHMFLDAVRVSMVDTAAIPGSSSNLTMMGSGSGGGTNNLLDNWIGKRLINESPATCNHDSGEMLLGSIMKVSASVFGHKDTATLHGGIRAIKIDNYMPCSPYPILLQTPPLSAKEDDEGHCLELRTTIFRSITNMTYFKKLFFKLKTIDLNLDENIVNWAQSFIDRAVVNAATVSTTDSQPGELEHWTLPQEALALVSMTNDGIIMDSHTATSTTSQKCGGMLGSASEMTRVNSPNRNTDMYFDLLYVAPIKVRFSFQCPARKAEDITSGGIKPVELLLNIMMKVNSSHMKLDKFVVTHETFRRSQFLAVCRAHYLRQLKNKAFSILGSLEALGNPVGLFRDMGQGVQDFVAEPVIGLVKSVEEMKPNKFFAGVARGGGSLLKNTAGGVANSASMITGTFSSILVSTMDSRYQRNRAKRAEERGRNPTDMLQGIGTGGISLVQGFSDGVTGVFVDPYKRAEKDGLAGFVRGVGSGVIGLVVKPVVGIGDAATNVLQGVKGTTETIAQSSSAQVERNASFFTMDVMRDGHLRPRRALYGHQRILRRYCLEDAQVASLLTTLPQFGKGLELPVHNRMEAIRSDGGMMTVDQQQSEHRQGRRIPDQYIGHTNIGSGVAVLTQSKIILFDIRHKVAFQEELGNIVGIEVDQVAQSHVHRLIIHLRTSMAAVTPAEIFAMKEGITLPPSPEDLQIMDEGATTPSLGGVSSRRVFNRVVECLTNEQCQQLSMLLENAIIDRPIWLL